MSTEIPLPGFLAEIKNTQKHVCTYTNSYIVLLGVSGGVRQTGKKKVINWESEANHSLHHTYHRAEAGCVH